MKPYLLKKIIIIEKKYNIHYGDNKICVCGHQYFRHFDTYEDMKTCGCKYCECQEYKERK